MTAPPKKATRSALPTPSWFAAAEVRTFALVADFMPKNPAMTEQRAPMRYAAAVGGEMAHANPAATTATATANMEYSRRRKAIAPAWICSAMAPIASLPLGWPFT